MTRSCLMKTHCNQKTFEFQTLKSWSRPRRVVGKAEYLQKGENPRFVVTSLSVEQFDRQTLDEQQYCGPGDMENRIKEQQLCLFADRTSAATMRALLLLYFGGLKPTLQLKIGAQIKVTVRKVWVSLSESYPYQQIFRQVYENLLRLCPIPLRC